jgi:hypothetical protein
VSLSTMASSGRSVMTHSLSGRSRYRRRLLMGSLNHWRRFQTNLPA